MSLNFKVFTLNCWGLLAVSKNRKSRISAIAEVLAQNQFDVVCLQEVWTDRDYNLIRERVSDVLPYSHYFYSGVTGSGICILSRHFIEETFFHQWSVNGYIHKLHHGDWWGGKGVGLCRLRVDHENDPFYINVYSTHLHAEYNRASDDYQAHRVLQAYDTAQFIMLTSGSADLIVLAGDLNTEPGDLAYRVLLTVPGLADSFMQAGKSGLLSQDSQDAYATNESYKNSYTPSSLVKNKFLGKRIDYVMYHPGSNVKVDLKSYDLPLPERVPKKNYSYSDHEAVLVELSVTKHVKSTENMRDIAAKQTVLKESIALCQEALRSITNTMYIYWLGVFILFILLVTSLVLPVVVSIHLFNGQQTVFAIMRVFVTLLMIFFFLMATLWYKIEMHGIQSGKLAMEVSLTKIKHSKNL